MALKSIKFELHKISWVPFSLYFHAVSATATATDDDDDNADNKNKKNADDNDEHLIEMLKHIIVDR